MKHWARLLLTLLALSVGGPLWAEDSDDEYEPKNWREGQVDMPPAPVESALLPFDVSAASENRFFVDGSSLSVGRDGVVRYVLVVLAAGGARNVSFEGIRCESRERRIYASGRSDGSWSKSRVDRWQKILDVPSHVHHGALFVNYFCPVGVIVRDTEEARDALRRGGHPLSKHW